MDIHQLRSFICVAERLNFSEAAKYLYLTQPTVSQHISDLEKQIQVKLFTRNTHSVQLTPAGQVFLEEAYNIIANSEKAILRTRRTASGLVGSLKIACVESTVKNFLPPLIKIFRDKYPNINIDLTVLLWEELNKALIHEDIDVGFTVSFALRNWTGITTQTIYTDTVCVVMPADHPLSKETKIDLCSVAHEPFITISPLVAPMPVYVTEEIFAKRGFMPNITRQPRFVEGIFMMIEAGMGIAILPHHTKFYAGPGLSFVDFDGDDRSIDLVAAWKNSNTNPSLSLFLAELPIQVQTG